MSLSSFIQALYDYFLIILVFAVLYSLYARIIRRKHNAEEALSGIDVQLTQRSQVIPNILKIAKKFLQHEEALFIEVTKLREQMDDSYDKADPSAVKQHLEVANQLKENMSKLMLRVEEYPDLKSNEVMLEAQQSYMHIEENISAARRFYNSAVADLNDSLKIFPGQLLGKLASASPMPMFTAEQGDLQNIDAGDFL